MNADPNPAKAIFLEAVERHAPEQWPAFRRDIWRASSPLLTGRNPCWPSLRGVRQAETVVRGPGPARVGDRLIPRPEARPRPAIAGAQGPPRIELPTTV
jgi:hypothetical protein